MQSSSSGPLYDLRRKWKIWLVASSEQLNRIQSHPTLTDAVPIHVLAVAWTAFRVCLFLDVALCPSSWACIFGHALRVCACRPGTCILSGTCISGRCVLRLVLPIRMIHEYVQFDDTCQSERYVFVRAIYALFLRPTHDAHVRANLHFIKGCAWNGHSTLHASMD